MSDYATKYRQVTLASDTPVNLFTSSVQILGIVLVSLTGGTIIHFSDENNIDLLTMSVIPNSTEIWKRAFFPNYQTLKVRLNSGGVGVVVGNAVLTVFYRESY